MAVPRHKTNQSNSLVHGSDVVEKLRRKKEINARYSRLLLSKTIKHFQKQGHVTIYLSEKCNENHKDEKLKIETLTTHQLTESKNRTISFWHFPRTVKCKFQFETNCPQAMRSVRTQTDFIKKKGENPCTQFDVRFNAKKTLYKTPNEILSSQISSGGNVMSVIMRSHDYVCDSEISGENAIAKDARTPTPRYNSERNAVRSRNFWSSYNNFILCNRSIELRITKLCPLQNDQYIVAFSKDLFDRREGSIIPRKEAYTYDVVCFVQFDACIYEMILVEHVSDLRMRMSFREQGNQWIERPSVTVGDGFSCRFVPSITTNLERKSTVSSCNGHCCRRTRSNRHERGAMAISILTLSFYVLFLLYLQITESFLQ